MTMSCRPSGQECAEVMAEPASQVSTFWFCCNTMWRHPTNQNQTCVREAQAQISWYSNLSLVLVLVLIQHVVTVTSSVAAGVTETLRVYCVSVTTESSVSVLHSSDVTSSSDRPLLILFSYSFLSLLFLSFCFCDFVCFITLFLWPV